MNTSAKPNVILYLVDDQDRTDYGCFGNPYVHTPAVDRLSREGTRFDRFYTAQAICAPSRSMLFTGMFPLKNGAYMNHRPLRNGRMSLIPELQKLGYKVILAGKSHVGPDSAFPWTEHWPSEEVPLSDGGQSARLPLDKIRAFLKTESGPYCLVLCSALPHPPYPEVPSGTQDTIPFYQGEDPENQTLIQKRTAYYENIRRDNLQIEAVLEAADQSQDPDNQLFLYLADHGNRQKFTLYEGGLNVPLVARWPGKIAAGTLSHELVSMVDLFPTLIDLAGGHLPAEVDGTPMTDLLLGRGPSPRNFTFGVGEHQNIFIPSVFPMRMVTDGKWKYIRNVNAYERHESNLGEHERINAFIREGADTFRHLPFEELYDLESDPFEQSNLANLPPYQKIQSRLSIQLDHWMEEQNDYLIEEGPLPLFRPSHMALDRPNPHYSPPAELAHTLKDSDYRDP